MPTQRPLFIPLKREHYEAYAAGTKNEELRIYGARWNERTCTIGRSVILSKGYGKHDRMAGRIWRFKRQHGSTFGSAYKAAIMDCYGTLDIWVAVISLNVLPPTLATKFEE